MTRNQAWQISRLAVALLVSAAMPVAQGADLEAFEFNDAGGTQLSAAANSVNAGNTWSADIPDSSVNSGAFFVGKPGDDFASSHLQIDDITSGSRFIVATMTDWNFFGSVVGEGEELRFSFLKDNTGTDGSSVTAEVRIDRNTDTEEIQLRGVAVGAGSRLLGQRATLNTTQSAAFTMVLELNKTSNTYEVFYKDGSNPSQSLGIGLVSPTRDGNSMRMVVNNNFFSDFSESLNIDRVALTDTNPLTDLLTLEVDRSSGEMKLINTSGAAVTGVDSVTFTSNSGALIDTQLNQFSGTLSIGQQVVLSDAGGAWVKNPDEDIRFELNLTGGETRAANVNFVGNGGQRYELGDLNFDGNLTAADWTTFISGAETDLSALTEAQAYQMGDLDGDGVNSIEDFGDFRSAYDAANGSGSFVAMLASVPEPSSLLLLTLGAISFAGRRRNHLADQA